MTSDVLPASGNRPSSWHPGVDLPITPLTGTLIAYGRTPWDQVSRMLTGTQAAWADYDGFHIGSPPVSPPPYSHLWAWTDDWLARIRIDGQHAITGVLALNGQPDTSPPEQWRQHVHVQHVRSQTWSPTEKRVGPLTPEVADRPADLYLVTGERSIAFVKIPPTPNR